MGKAIIVDKLDNVVVAIEPIKKGEEATYLWDGQAMATTAAEDITIYHKLSIREIKKGEPIVKYGQHIGVASVDILKGAHVHIHNVENRRENL